MKQFLFCFFLAMCVSSSVSAKIWRVNNNPEAKAQFLQPQAAHDAAGAGDTIMIEGSAANYESITCIKKLVILGTGYFLNENEVLQYNPYVSSMPDINLTGNGLLNSSGSIVMGLTVGRIMISSDNNTISRCNISQNVVFNSGANNFIIQSLIGWMSNYTRKTQIISNCILNGASLGSIFNPAVIIYEVGDSLYINNCIIKAECNTEKSIYKSNIFLVSSTVNSNFYSNNVATTNFLPTTGDNVVNADAASLFVCSTPGTKCPDFTVDGGYALAPGSAAKGAGVGGVDCGIFGGEYPYVLSGMPPVPAIYDMKTVNGFNSLNVTVKAKSH